MIRTISALLLSAALAASAPAFASGGGEMPVGTLGADMEQSPGMTPAELEAAYNEGVKAIDAQDWKKAISRFGDVTTNVPSNADGWNYLGYAQRKGGFPRRSETSYKKALKIDPNHPRANEYYGELLVELNRIPDAEKRLAVLKACCAADPGVATLSDMIDKAKASAAASAAKPSTGY